MDPASLQSNLYLATYGVLISFALPCALYANSPSGMFLCVLLQEITFFAFFWEFRALEDSFGFLETIDLQGSILIPCFKVDGKEVAARCRFLDSCPDLASAMSFFLSAISPFNVLMASF